jgi:hypothetical protein
MMRAIVPTCMAFMLTVACGASRVPHALRGYNILVEEKDEQSVELARAMRAQGVKVRPKVRGGSGPTAAASLSGSTFGSRTRGRAKSLVLRRFCSIR